LRHRYELTLYAPVQLVVGRLLDHEAVETKLLGAPQRLDDLLASKGRCACVERPYRRLRLSELRDENLAHLGYYLAPDDTFLLSLA
jgi:hypothetical protein